MISKTVHSVVMWSATFSLFLSGCQPHAEGVRETSVIRHFFLEMSPHDQAREFTAYSLDEQYNLYIWGNQVVYPPAVFLARPFARQGPKIVPFLAKKLESAKEEVTVRDITAVFRELADLKLYDFSSNPELMDLLDRTANAMEGQWKDATLRDIREIRRGRKGEITHLWFIRLERARKCTSGSETALPRTRSILPLLCSSP
jgi:hypothetical protein